VLAPYGIDGSERKQDITGFTAQSLTTEYVYMYQILHRLLLALRAYSPIPLLVIGSGILYVFISVGFWSIAGPLLGVVIAAVLTLVGLLYRALRGRGERSPQATPDPLDVRIPIILACTYAVSVLVLFRYNTYARPDLMYVLFGGYTGLIGYQIARGEGRRRIVPQVLVLAFFTYWSSQFLFPAGMWDPDTHYSYVPKIQTMLATHRIPATVPRHAGHLAYGLEFTLVSGLSARISYYLLATLVLCGTVTLLAVLHNVLPSITPRVALYAALLFSIMSWMIGRGMHPNKLNFFYPLILLLGMSAIKVYQSSVETQWEHARWFSIGLVVSPAIVFGHRYSAGATLMFSLLFGVFVGLTRSVLKREYPTVPQGAVVPFVLVYFLQVIGNPVHQGPLLSRISDTILSVVAETNPVVGNVPLGGSGRYSQLPLDVLAVSTAAQTLLFIFAVIGAVWMFRQAEWEFDFVLFWIAGVAVLLVVALLWNSADTAPQRFYSLLGVFGFNICAGVFLYRLEWSRLFSRWSSVNVGPSAVAILLAVLAVTSLASPVADKVTSPVNEDIPHVRQFETHQRVAGDDWTGQYTTNGTLRVVAPENTAPIRETGRVNGVINSTAIGQGTVYVYSELSARSGIISGDSETFGGRTVIFVDPPSVPGDAVVYRNGQTSVYVGDRR